MVGCVAIVDSPPASSCILDIFPEVFKGFGRVAGEYCISIDTCVRPMVYAPRKVPLALLEGAQSELDSMESKDIIAKVNCLTPCQLRSFCR